MSFSEHYKTLDHRGKRNLADRLGTSVAYLSQIANGHRNAGRKIFQGIHSATNGAVTVQDLLEANPRQTRGPTPASKDAA